MLSATQAAWIVPIQLLAYVHTGPLDSMGVIADCR